MLFVNVAEDEGVFRLADLKFDAAVVKMVKLKVRCLFPAENLVNLVSLGVN